ncbi:hypothetical protein [Nonomuraea sp. SYSU D8015]|uniref:hypothetical protein n=1 Tax=Nonomuraea sp. SYSU D8015 TaxID=2593644 RepID=UPI001660D497|nr:hypothetical protein [Nonomuraea sp. SYSU D8015]
MGSRDRPDARFGDRTGTAHWTTSDTFANTRREVVTEIDAFFGFDDNCIVRHHDEFDLRHWSTTARGRT